MSRARALSPHYSRTPRPLSVRHRGHGGARPLGACPPLPSHARAARTTSGARAPDARRALYAAAAWSHAHGLERGRADGRAGAPAAAHTTARLCRSAGLQPCTRPGRAYLAAVSMPSVLCENKKQAVTGRNGIVPCTLAGGARRADGGRDGAVGQPPRRSDAGGRTGVCWVRGTASGHEGRKRGKSRCVKSDDDVVSCFVFLKESVLFASQKPCSSRMWVPYTSTIRALRILFLSP
jgi:hypothetical protein